MTAFTAVVASLATWVYLYLGDGSGFIPVFFLGLWLVGTATDEFEREED